MASAVVKVIQKCEDAQETQHLDLSDCQLVQVPDAVYHLMRNTELKSCDLSKNVITKIPPKFPIKFNLITHLNLSQNQVSKLPDELTELEYLEKLDISFNTFISLPNCVFKIKNLQMLNAENNFIIDFNVDSVEEACALKKLHLRNNPLSSECYDKLCKMSGNNCEIILSAKEDEDWKDLTI